MKTLKLLFTLFFILAVSACGGGKSSSDDNAAETVTGENGATVTFSSNEVLVGDVYTLSYDLGGDEFTGTIRWGDNTQVRVRGSGTVNHIYRGSGTVSVSVQIDGGESVRMGNISVKPAPVSVPEAEEPSVAFVNPTTVDCSSTASFPIRLNGQRFTYNPIQTSGSFGFTIDDLSGTIVATSSGLVVCPGSSVSFSESATANGSTVTVQEQVGTSIFLITITP